MDYVSSLHCLPVSLPDSCSPPKPLASIMPEVLARYGIAMEPNTEEIAKFSLPPFGQISVHVPPTLVAS